MQLTTDLSLVVMFAIALACIGFVLAWVLLAIRFAKRARERKQSAPTSHYQKVFGYNLFCKQTGTGPNILLIHGIGASHYVWRFITPLLAKHFTVTEIDLLGFGKSDKPESFLYDLDSQCDVVVELLRQLEIESCYVVGSSMGGTIALRLAQTHPEIFRKVATLSPAADPKIAFLDLNKLLFLSPIVRPLVTEQLVKQIMKRVYSEPSLITPEALKVYSEPFAGESGSVESFVKSFKLLRDPRVYQHLEEIKVPTLILWGKNDKIISFKFAEKIKSKLSNSRLEAHKSAGHHVQEDAPDWTAEKILEFFQSS